MSKIDYQKLREIAEKTKIAGEAPVMPFDQRINALNDFMKHFSPDIALALLDEINALEETRINDVCRIAELTKQLELAKSKLNEQREYYEGVISDGSKRITIVVHSPGRIGSTPSVEVQSIQAGFDWDAGKVMIFPAQPLTTLTPEQVADITDSVRKGQSWHAYQEYKKHKEQLEKLSMELEAAKQREKDLFMENVRLKSGIAGLIHLGIRYADVEVMKIAGDAQLSTPCTDSIINSIAAGIFTKEGAAR